MFFSLLTDAAALTSEDHDCHIEEGHFLCASKDECIQASKFCDKSRDCTDGSDEFDGCGKASLCFTPALPDYASQCLKITLEYP